MSQVPLYCTRGGCTTDRRSTFPRTPCHMDKRIHSPTCTLCLSLPFFAFLDSSTSLPSKDVLGDSGPQHRKGTPVGVDERFWIRLDPECGWCSWANDSGSELVQNHSHHFSPSTSSCLSLFFSLSPPPSLCVSFLPLSLSHSLSLSLSLSFSPSLFLIRLTFADGRPAEANAQTCWPSIRSTVQGYLSHKKRPPPQGPP